RAAQAAALARFALESPARRPRRVPHALRRLELAVLPVTAAAVLYAASDWLGSLWTSAESAIPRSQNLPRLEPGWLEEIGSAMAAQPWLVICGAAALALLWLPPVRAALLGERE
ncbi:MAG: hypothetical protein O3A20_09035, partial [Planctomycetota bacterium]|nr:hypothetical protein [Planctomycetota bacterium]